MRLGHKVLLAVSLAASVLWAGRVEGTVDMQVQAKKLGFNVVNCLYCHATPHAVDKMKDKAKALAMADGNCLACHGANIPATLNDRGHWLVAEKRKRGAKECDMVWLREYKEPTPPPAAAKPHPRP
jgi:mono/diheme cytochrome c family protein